MSSSTVAEHNSLWGHLSGGYEGKWGQSELFCYGTLHIRLASLTYCRFHSSRRAPVLSGASSSLGSGNTWIPHLPLSSSSSSSSSCTCHTSSVHALPNSSLEDYSAISPSSSSSVNHSSSSTAIGSHSVPLFGKNRDRSYTWSGEQAADNNTTGVQVHDCFPVCEICHRCQGACSTDSCTPQDPSGKCAIDDVAPYVAVCINETCVGVSPAFTAYGQYVPFPLRPLAEDLVDQEGKTLLDGASHFVCNSCSPKSDSGVCGCLLPALWPHQAPNHPAQSTCRRRKSFSVRRRPKRSNSCGAHGKRSVKQLDAEPEVRGDVVKQDTAREGVCGDCGNPVNGTDLYVQLCHPQSKLTLELRDKDTTPGVVEGDDELSRVEIPLHFLVPGQNTKILVLFTDCPAGHQSGPLPVLPYPLFNSPLLKYHAFLSLIPSTVSCFSTPYFELFSEAIKGHFRGFPHKALQQQSGAEQLGAPLTMVALSLELNVQPFTKLSLSVQQLFPARLDPPTISCAPQSFAVRNRPVLAPESSWPSGWEACLYDVFGLGLPKPSGSWSRLVRLQKGLPKLDCVQLWWDAGRLKTELQNRLQDLTRYMGKVLRWDLPLHSLFFLLVYLSLLAHPASAISALFFITALWLLFYNPKDSASVDSGIPVSSSAGTVGGSRSRTCVVGGTGVSASSSSSQAESQSSAPPPLPRHHLLTSPPSLPSSSDMDDNGLPLSCSKIISSECCSVPSTALKTGVPASSPRRREDGDESGVVKESPESKKDCKPSSCGGLQTSVIQSVLGGAMTENMETKCRIFHKYVLIGLSILENFPLWLTQRKWKFATMLVTLAVLTFYSSLFWFYVAIGAGTVGLTYRMRPIFFCSQVVWCVLKYARLVRKRQRFYKALRKCTQDVFGYCSQMTPKT